MTPSSDSSVYVTFPEPVIFCFGHAMLYVTVLPSIFRSLILQSLLGPCGTALSAFLTSSSVTQWLVVTGGIFTGMPGMSICIVICHLPAFCGLAANSGAASANTATANNVLRIVIA